MWLKKNNRLFNLERFDAVVQDKEIPDILWLQSGSRQPGTAACGSPAESGPVYHQP